MIVDTAKNIRQHIHQQIAAECRRSLRTCLSIQSEPIADDYKKDNYSVGYYDLITKKSASHLTPEQLPSQDHYLLRLRFPYFKKGGGILILAGNNSFAGLEINKGTVVLTGNNHYSQSTMVNNGILVVNGTLSSAINLNNDGRLMGSGSIAGLKVNKGGILALGNWIGQLSD